MTLLFRQQPTNVAAGSSIKPPIVIEVRDQAGKLVKSFQGNITIQLTPQTGNPSARLSGKTTRKVGGGVATFDNLSIDLVGSGYRLRALASFGSLDSAPFSVH
jgi:hypothetical protein